MEMNGKVVSQGVVPKAVCTPRALSNVRKIFQLLKKTQNKSSTLLIVCAQKNQSGFQATFEGRNLFYPEITLRNKPYW